MSWPTLIQLHDSEFSHAYDGSEVRETWYVEPMASVDAFIASMLGRVDANGVQPNRTNPAAHFRYPWCLATACDVVPQDSRSYSYMGATNYQGVVNPNGVSGAMQIVAAAVQTYNKANKTSLYPTANINTADIVSQTNAAYSSGAYVAVTYKPVLFPPPSSGQAVVNLDAVNYRFETRERTNVINAGLKLITPQMLVNLFGAWNMFYPAAGIAPVVRETYQQFIAERRMLLPTFDISKLSQYNNCVNGGQSQIANLPYTFPSGTLLFRGIEGPPQFVQVPSVDINGEPNGFNRWLNLTLRYDWRTTLSPAVRDINGNIINGAAAVTHNHVLAYPGTLSWINGEVAGSPAGLGWYRAKYSANAAGADTDPFPTVTTAVGNNASIFDPLTNNW